MNNSVPKKHMLDLRVSSNQRLNEMYALLKLTPVKGESLPKAQPGQFVQVMVADSRNTFLRRPISINNIDEERNELWLLVRKAGEGTRHIIEASVESTINVILPLGKGFPLDIDVKNPLLVGGGVGVAPLLYLGRALKAKGVTPRFLLGARSYRDLLELEDFSAIGEVYASTEDGTYGEAGLVTHHSVLEEPCDVIYCCGPMPMMKAVAGIARDKGKECYVSLENVMACGLGACLCCVEPTQDGNLCVCTEGPVFNIKQLKWEN